MPAVVGVSDTVGQATRESHHGAVIGSEENQEIKLAENDCCFAQNIRMMRRTFKLQPGITCTARNLNDTTSTF